MSSWYNPAPARTVYITPEEQERRALEAEEARRKQDAYNKKINDGIFRRQEETRRQERDSLESTLAREGLLPPPRFETDPDSGLPVFRLGAQPSDERLPPLLDTQSLRFAPEEFRLSSPVQDMEGNASAISGPMRLNLDVAELRAPPSDERLPLGLIPIEREATPLRTVQEAVSESTPPRITKEDFERGEIMPSLRIKNPSGAEFDFYGKAPEHLTREIPGITMGGQSMASDIIRTKGGYYGTERALAALSEEEKERALMGNRELLKGIVPVAPPSRAQLDAQARWRDTERRRALGVTPSGRSALAAEEARRARSEGQIFQLGLDDQRQRRMLQAEEIKVKASRQEAEADRKNKIDVARTTAEGNANAETIRAKTARETEEMKGRNSLESARIKAESDQKVAAIKASEKPDYLTVGDKLFDVARKSWVDPQSKKEYLISDMKPADFNDALDKIQKQERAFTEESANLNALLKGIPKDMQEQIKKNHENLGKRIREVAAQFHAEFKQRSRNSDGSKQKPNDDVAFGF